MRRFRSSASRLTEQRYGIGPGCARCAPARAARGAALASRPQLPAIGLPQLGDVELRLTEHDFHGPLRAGRIGAADQLVQLARHDLPGDAEAVLEPAAHARLAAARDQCVPVAVDLGLVLAVDEERDRLVEL